MDSAKSAISSVKTAISSLTDPFTKPDKKFITPENSPRKDKKNDVSPLTPNTPNEGDIIIPYTAPPPPSNPAPQLMRPMPRYQPPLSAPQPPIEKAPLNSRPYKEPYKGGKTRKRKIKKRKTKRKEREENLLKIRKGNQTILLSLLEFLCFLKLI